MSVETALGFAASGKTVPTRIAENYIHLINQSLSLDLIASAETAPDFAPLLPSGVLAERVAEAHDPRRSVLCKAL
jgi:hypothetical protein